MSKRADAAESVGDTGDDKIWKGYAEVLACTAVWAGFSVVAKLALSDARPEMLASWRFLLAGVLLWPWLWLTKSLPRRPKDAAAWRQLLLLAFLSVFIHNLLLFFGLRWGSAYEVGLIPNTVIPIATPIIAALLKVEAFDRQRLPGLLVGSAGVALIFAGTSMSFRSSHFVGMMFFFCAGLGWSTYTVLSRKAQGQWAAAELSAWVTWLGASMLLPFGLYWPLTHGWPVFSMALNLKLAYLAVPNTILAFFWWQSGMQKIGAARSSALVYLVPVFSLVLSAAVLGERPARLQLAGGALAMLGVLWANRRELVGGMRRA